MNSCSGSPGVKGVEEESDRVSESQVSLRPVHPFWPRSSTSYNWSLTVLLAPFLVSESRTQITGKICLLLENLRRPGPALAPREHPHPFNRLLIIITDVLDV